LNFKINLNKGVIMKLRHIGSLFMVIIALAGCGKDKGEKASMAVPGTQQDLENTVSNRVFFDFDTSKLDMASKEKLKAQAKWLKSHPKAHVMIEGHCDQRGTRNYNMALGERRANAAKRFLVSQGVEAGRIQTTSYGKERPAVLGSSEEVHKLNRRAVTVIK
jgi:peptidoglycan-associated lipoprotein